MTIRRLLDAELLQGSIALTIEIDPMASKAHSRPDAILGRVSFEFIRSLTVDADLHFKSLVLVRGATYRTTLPIPRADGPLRAVRITAEQAENTILFEEGLDSRLARLYPLDGPDYVDLLASHTRRWGSANTRYFLAEQVTRFFVDHPEHRIGASLIQAYKAVELGKAGLIEAALGINQAAFGWLDTLSVDWHPRRNSEHLEVSLLTAKWHLELAGRDIQAFRATLHRMLTLTSTPKADYATLAYSASKSLLLGGWLEWRHGDEVAAKLFWNQTVAMFKLAVRDADPYRAVLFRELEHSLKAAWLAGLCLRNLGKRRNDMPTLEQIIDNAVRVPGRTRRHLQTILEELLPPVAVIE
ncbi:hypothetical protein [Roseomonas indoligenes]|uniref:Uncharacterized protein n=1 Tax=Roseomonas indoligenes TaxID=2820811 RepID=A0A940MW26_9PROT|nr:hypothetical protein [Pararoseomonas indoligenes]MBP0495273.1 hypothetical protein [Pararoseomonas indoligenes]